MPTERKYKRFCNFYRYYLTEHDDPKNRLLHFIGTGLIIILLIVAVAFQKWWVLAVIPVCGYGFAWVGHYFFEKNRPATFIYPLYSLGSDFVMFWHILSGQLNRKMKRAHQIIHKNT